MCAPVPKGRWAWKYDKCIICDTRKIRHKGRGLCVHCWDRRRGQNPRRKERQKRRHEKFYLKVKGTPEYRESCRLKVKRWREDENSGYKLFLQKVYLRNKFKRFLNRKRPLKRDLGGVKIRCEGCEKECLITTPIKPGKLNGKIQELQLFKKVLIENCGQNPTKK